VKSEETITYPLINMKKSITLIVVCQLKIICKLSFLPYDYIIRMVEHIMTSMTK